MVLQSSPDGRSGLSESTAVSERRALPDHWFRSQWPEPEERGVASIQKQNTNSLGELLSARGTDARRIPRFTQRLAIDA
jgi:hypothetical protein